MKWEKWEKMDGSEGEASHERLIIWWELGQMYNSDLLLLSGGIYCHTYYRWDQEQWG